MDEETEIYAYELSTDHVHTRELLAVVADLLPDDTAAGPGHHGSRSAATIDSTFIRECLKCGKTIEITVYEDDTYEGGH
ncbi:hypothetical protein SAMN05192561_10511 [Halopenitus malekzadehii]|uniref:Uncharacterized protein n=1 Tax=Halopenitus malekzadehii TaxID=1267564 RepID=A0A1H6IV99_9EURY|nr:hypothetical protein [Halopenitus malekzadehii]SEH53195.1 hypothetical protein SAMN05192561_10511 [Halopenitus malekzadehii]